MRPSIICSDTVYRPTRVYGEDTAGGRGVLYTLYINCYTNSARLGRTPTHDVVPRLAEPVLQH